MQKILLQSIIFTVPWYIILLLGILVLLISILVVVNYRINYKRKKAEETIREGENKYRFMSENVNDWIWTFDIKTKKITFTNNICLEMLGYTNQEIMQMELFDVVHPSFNEEVTTRLLLKIKEYDETGILPVYRHETKFKHKNGSEIWIETSVRMVANEKDELTHLIASSRNIEDRKKLEMALTDSERKLRTISENTRDTFWIIDLQTLEFLFVAGAHYEMFGYTYSEFLKLSIDIFFPPEAKERIYELINKKIQKYYETGKIKNYRYESLHFKKDGTTFWGEVTLQFAPDENGKITKIVGSTCDIEERKQAQKALEESESRYRLISENTKELFWIIDIHTLKYTFVSGACYELTGYTVEERMEMTLKEFFPPEQSEYVLQIVKDKVKEYIVTGIPHHTEFETQILRKDGQKIWVEVNARLVPDENGVIAQIVGVTRDIDERKKTQIALEESQRQYRLISENTRDLFWILDIQTWQYKFVSGACYELTGNTAEERMKLKMNDFFPPEHLKYISKLIQQKEKEYRETGISTPAEFESQIIHRDGQRIWVEISAQLVPDKNGVITQIVGVTRNIEKRKNAELALVESERKYQFISENTSDIFWIMEIPSYKYLFTGGAEMDMYGYTNEEFLNKTLYDIIPKENIEKLNLIIAQKTKEYSQTGIVPFFRFESDSFHKDGTPFWVEASIRLVPDKNGVFNRMTGITRNIEERKIAETALIESEQKLRTISENIKDSFWILDLLTLKITFVAGAYYELLGFTFDEFMHFTLNDIFTPDSLNIVFPLLEEKSKIYYQTGKLQNYHYEGKLYHKDGREIWCEISVQLVPDENGQLVKAVGSARNIEERKKTEAALIESEQKLRTISENTNDSYWILDLSTLKFTFVAGAYYELLGFTFDEFMQFNLNDVFTPDSLNIVYPLLEEKSKIYYQTGELQNYQYEGKLYHKDGREIWCEISVQLVPDENGKLVKAVGSAVNIEERKKAQAALIESEHKLRTISENTKDTFWILDLQTLRFTFVAGAYRQMYGYSYKDFMNDLIMDDLFTPQYREFVHNLRNEKSKKYYETGKIQSYQYEAQMRRKDGTDFWCEISVQLIPDENGKIVKAVGSSDNIEERKKIETALIESENKYRFISENVNDVIWVLDLKTLAFTYFSSTCYELFGYTPEEMCKKRMEELLTPDSVDLAYQIIHTEMKNYEETGILTNHKNELRQFRKDKPPIWIEISIRGIANEKGELFQFIGITRDIEKRKNNEAKILKQKQELETQQRKITDSIVYASEIQKIFLMPNELLPQVFPNHFIINRPKEIVSGDFYFCQQVGKYKIFILADCTGHGVPGAFMSLISARFMREIIIGNNYYMPNEILDNLRQRIIQTMHQPEGMLSQNQDGLDAAVITVDTEEKIMYFSGANMGIYVVNGQQLTRYISDLMPVGIYINQAPFTLNIIPITEPFNVYVHTDGFVDQLSKHTSRKFLSKRLQSTLLRIQKFDFQEQQYFLEKYFNLWKKDTKQTDDVLFVGFEVGVE